MPYRILLADDHAFVLEGISNWLRGREDCRVDGAFTDGESLMAAVAEAPPNLVIIDLNMPGLDGMECLRRLKRQHPEVRALVLSAYSQPSLIAETRAAGAAAYVLKSAPPLVLGTALDAVMAGGTYFPEPGTAGDEDFFDGFLKRYQLTRREAEIIRHIVRGLTSRQIAAELHLSELTVATHRKNIMRKLEIPNVAALVSFGRANNLF